ncbi:topless-related protein 1-like [Hibiscus syriacus]|uniref:topless-related protein 1-like n=1 Tax=Hibiscus syriacus TaxID=106335 RepID=UPI00192389A8|nr:topless-related protein 1-like [Hibiscus syriacus]XP_039044304.1 topless-related protein 1-like [Hibiscus syriacus]XP_039044305.1 topless-related protein 1-like [Hibiscus syriacus]XP_039044306.1 topless-related protein 1-like [Hibiscus syriacus]
MGSEKRSTLNKELLFLILQFCNDEGYKKTAHMLEQESGCCFDMVFFEDLVLNGKWNMVEEYLSGFTSINDNKYSTKIYFEIRKLNFLEALDNNDRAKALDILRKDLKVFAEENEELFREMTQLLTLDNLREHELLSTYEDAESSRKILMSELKKLIELNPIFHGKLKFPVINSQRLRRLINQSLNWQHIQCKYPQPNPDIETLFEDHVCQWPQNHLLMQSTDNLLQDASLPVFPSGWFSGPSTVTHAVSGEDICISGPISSDNIGDCHAMPQKSLLGAEYEVTSTVIHPGRNHSPESSVSDELPITSMNNGMPERIEPINNTNLPKTVAKILTELSSPMSMDFHPEEQTFLLVGTNVGDIGLWDVNSGVKMLSRNFTVWNVGACTMVFKAAMMKDPCMSVNRVAWSPNGSFFGVAYSKHIVQLYSYHGGTDVQQKLEIDAHVGGVNDLAFATPSKQHLVITGGDDKLIKVWDVITGEQMHNLEGHEASVYSLLPHCKDGIHFIFSTSVDGKIKAWLYDNMGARVHMDAPGLACTTMAYSADNTRLFSCGTNKNGESFLVEWNESEGDAKRTYQGLCKNSSAVVQFSPIKEKFLAAADDHVFKIWDMDKVEHLTTINVGDLPANPHIRFNKDGTLLAVIANQNKIKILATADGLQLLNASPTVFVDFSTDVSDAPRKHVINPSSSVANSGEADDCHVSTNFDKERIKDVKNKIIDKSNNNSDVSKIIQISMPSQCKSLLLSVYGEADKISRLIYTNAGNAILALASNATHLLWKWPRNDLNLSGKATTDVPPQLWQPKSGPQRMINDITGITPEEAVPFFALSKNESYLLSTSGGRISLFNMLTFKIMMNFMPPPPAATSLAFHPQDNNIVAVGMTDSTILIYNVRVDKVKSKLKGHSGRVTGLAFSTSMNLLVSSGADAQIFTWNLDGWGNCKSKLLQFPNERIPVMGSNTMVQFHQDQVHFIVVHETQLSIYEAKELECVHQWVPEDSTRISQATFSCDSQMVYACFVDGKVAIFGASDLELKCQILPTSYIPPSARSNAYPHAIAAHPQKPTQFAVGLTDGAIIVLEPHKPGVSWYLAEYESVTARSCLVQDD